MMGVCAYDVLRHRAKPMDIHQRRINAQNISCVNLPKQKASKPQIKSRATKTIKILKKKAKKARPQKKQKSHKGIVICNGHKISKEAQNNEDYNPNIIMLRSNLDRCVDREGEKLQEN
eukprot:596763_1